MKEYRFSQEIRIISNRIYLTLSLSRTHTHTYVYTNTQISKAQMRLTKLTHQLITSRNICMWKRLSHSDSDPLRKYITSDKQIISFCVISLPPDFTANKSKSLKAICELLTEQWLVIAPSLKQRLRGRLGQIRREENLILKKKKHLRQDKYKNKKCDS